MKGHHNNQQRCMNCGRLVKNAKYKNKCPSCKLFSIECEFCLRGICDINEKNN